MLGQRALALRTLPHRCGTFAPIEMPVFQVDLVNVLDQFRIRALESISNDPPERLIDQEQALDIPAQILDLMLHHFP